MNQLWNSIIFPILRRTKAKNIVEIGSGNIILTKNILEYAISNNSHLIIVDPILDYDEFKEENSDQIEFYPELSLNRLPFLEDYDTILIDGDHNWYTVYNELKIIEEKFKNKQFPLIFITGLGWPRARNDQYNNPENIPASHRQPYTKTEKSLKKNYGLTSDKFTAINGNNPKNGVLTALEDFIKESSLDLSFKNINAFSGLGILYIKNNKMDNIVENVIETSNISNLLEEEIVNLKIKIHESKIQNNELQRNLNENNRIGSESAQTETQMSMNKTRLNTVETELKDKKTQLESLNQKILIKESNDVQVKKLLNKLDKIETNYLEIRYDKNYDRSYSQRITSKFTILNILLNRNKGLKNALANIKGYYSIKKNNLFDVGYYLKNNKDVMVPGKDPFIHYLYHGYKENRNPNPKFSFKYYLTTYEDARKSDLDPLIHYSLYGIKDKRRTNIKIAIKIPVPTWKIVNEWGDYHFAMGLKKEFERKGCEVIIQVVQEWYDNSDDDCDVVLVLRGIQKYRPKSHHFNIMWNISHPDEIDIDEYNQYDYVLIASEIWAEKIKKSVDVPVETMLQCCDPELFYPEHSNEYKHDILFVGNSRRVFRKIIKDLMPTDKSLAVYGANWEDFIDEKYIKGTHVPNKELRKAYSSCKILLNDHWDDMREKGFISNRIFDGFASGALIISDHIKGADNVFDETLIIYDTPDELNNLIDKYLNNKELRHEKVEIMRNFVIEHHTFQNRAEFMLKIIKSNI